MPAVKFTARLDLEQICLFLDGHYLYSFSGAPHEAILVCFNLISMVFCLRTAILMESVPSPAGAAVHRWTGSAIKKGLLKTKPHN
jgi:hypothetical protein